MSLHIEALKENISNIVLMPGDPKRCEFIANNYLTDVKLVNTIRNMNAYTGVYKGIKISIVPSGMGMPSLGIYAHELYTCYDVDTIIRIGTCGTFNKKVFDVILVEEANTTSTFAYEYNKQNTLTSTPNKELNDKIKETAIEKNIDLINGNIFTTDSFYKNDASHEMIFDGVEMETFALFHIANSLNKKAATLLTVSDVIGTDQIISAEDREKGLIKMIELALETTIKI